MIVVIPSAREINLNYLSPLIDGGARFIIVDDSEGSIRINHPGFRVFNWADRKRIAGKYSEALPVKNGACRDLGFLIAWKESDENEIIIALDDDCEVYEANFMTEVVGHLEKRSRKVPLISGKHFNILDIYADIDKNLYPRGFPYSARLDYQYCTTYSELEAESSFNLGMWRGVFDVNAIDKLYGSSCSHDHAVLEHDSVLIPEGVLVSACSMNMQFRRELIPAVYQLPMHIEIMPGWNIDRYGDIWGGFILKTLMDIRRDAFTAGAPVIHHKKEGNYLRNIWQEHLCHLVNDEFICVLNDAKSQICRSDYSDMMSQLSEIMKSSSSKNSPILSKYLKHLTHSMDAWCQLLK
jgi:hypothetical protein